MKRFALLMLTVACLVPCAHAKPAKKDEPVKHEWSVMALTVRRGDGRLPDGVWVTAKLRLPEHEIVGIDRRQLSVKITDSLKNDLAAKPFEFGFDLGESRLSGPRITRDYKSITVTFATAKCPARGATSIRIVGTAEVWSGRGAKEFEKKEVTLGESAVDLGIGNLKPTARPKDDRFGGPLVLPHALHYAGSLPISKLQAITADGKVIDYQRHSYFVENADRKVAFGARFSAEPGGKVLKQKDTTIRISYFGTVEKVTIPIDLDLSLGF